METYKKYLVSEKREFDKMKLTKRKDAFDKIIKVIKSLRAGGSQEQIEKSYKQYKMARQMYKNFMKVYGSTLSGKFRNFANFMMSDNMSDWVHAGKDGKIVQSLGKKVRELEGLLDSDKWEDA